MMSLLSMPSSALATSIMATLMMSAADPWMGVLTAFRSAKARTTALLLEMSGSGLWRPMSVVACPSSRALATQSWVKACNPENWAW